MVLKKRQKSSQLKISFVLANKKNFRRGAKLNSKWGLIEYCFQQFQHYLYRFDFQYLGGIQYTHFWG